MVFEIDSITKDQSGSVTLEKSVRELHLVGTDQMMMDLTNTFYNDDLSQITDVSCALHQYNTILQDTIDKHAPKILKQHTLAKNCWWDNKCQGARRKR